jgi:hypothetical protein
VREALFSYMTYFIYLQSGVYLLILSTDTMKCRVWRATGPGE